MAGAALRLCVGLWLVLQIAYTPIHLYRMPHSDESDISHPAPLASAATFESDQHQDGDEHHERHSALQHKFKVTQPTRAIVAEMMPVQAMEWADPHQDGPRPPVVDFSGLSPPELPRCWQFLFRTALPVRAPSLLS